jgi:predicted aspartyl protease
MPKYLKISLSLLISIPLLIIYISPGHSKTINLPVTVNADIKEANISIQNVIVKGIVDTGASTILLNGKTFCKLIKTKILKEKDIVGNQAVSLANGTQELVVTYKLNIKIENIYLTNITGATIVKENSKETCLQDGDNLFGNSLWNKFKSVIFTQNKVFLNY